MTDKPEKGFCFKLRAADDVSSVYVNVTGHHSIGMPQSYGGEPVSEAHVDTHGIDNLQVPIAVGPLLNDTPPAAAGAAAQKKVVETTAASGAKTSGAQKKTFIVEVVVHTCVALKCRGVWQTSGGPLAMPKERQHLVARVVVLAADWVTRETGLRLRRDGVKLLETEAFRMPRHQAARRSANGGQQLSPAAEAAEMAKAFGELMSGQGPAVADVEKAFQEMSNDVKKQQSGAAAAAAGGGDDDDGIADEKVQEANRVLPDALRLNKPAAPAAGAAASRGGGASSSSSATVAPAPAPAAAKAPLVQDITDGVPPPSAPSQRHAQRQRQQARRQQQRQRQQWRAADQEGFPERAGKARREGAVRAGGDRGRRVARRRRGPLGVLAERLARAVQRGGRAGRHGDGRRHGEGEAAQGGGGD